MRKPHLDGFSTAASAKCTMYNEGCWTRVYESPKLCSSRRGITCPLHDPELRARFSRTTREYEQYLIHQQINLNASAEQVMKGILAEAHRR